MVSQAQSHVFYCFLGLCHASQMKRKDMQAQITQYLSLQPPFEILPI